MIFHFASCRMEENLREVVALKSAEQKQPHERLVSSVEFQHLVGERSEIQVVIPAACGFVEVLFHPLSRLLHLIIQNRAIKIVLRSEMTKYDGLAYARLIGNLFGGCSAKPLLREEFGRDRDNLFTPAFGAHSGRLSSLRGGCSCCHQSTPEGLS